VPKSLFLALVACRRVTITNLLASKELRTAGIHNTPGTKTMITDRGIGQLEGVKWTSMPVSVGVQA
jgi:hypothetical protein